MDARSPVPVSNNSARAPSLLALPAVVSGNSLEVLTFYVSGKGFCLAIDRIRDIVVPAAMCRIPLSKPWVRGAMNLRGKVVLVVDIGMWLGVSETPSGARGAPFYCITVQSDNGEVYGFSVDGVGNVVTIQNHDIFPVPSTLSSALKIHVDGVCQIDGHLVTLLDSDFLESL